MFAFVEVAQGHPTCPAAGPSFITSEKAVRFMSGTIARGQQRALFQSNSPNAYASGTDAAVADYWWSAGLTAYDILGTKPLWAR